MDRLSLFGGALLKRWWALMSCAVFTFIGLYGLILQKSNRWIIGASFFAAIVLFLVAAFLAWNDEHSAKLKLESDVIAPKIDLGWGPNGSPQKHLIIENSGTVDAYDLQIQDVSLTPNLKGTFDQVTRLRPKGQFIIDPWLTGRGISQAPSKTRDFEMILYSSGDLPQEYTTSTSDGRLAEIRCPLVIAFKDYGGNQYEASFEFVTDTLRYIDKVRFMKVTRKNHT
jgi:hypothetical protein